MNFAELEVPLMAAVSLAVGTIKLAVAVAAWLPWAQLALVACGSVALGWALCWVRDGWSARTAPVAGTSEPPTANVPDARLSGSPPTRAVLHDLSPHQYACLVVLDTAFDHACAELHSETVRNNAGAICEVLHAIRRLPASAAGDMLSTEHDVRDVLGTYDERERNARLPDGSISFRASGGLHTIYLRAFEERRALLANRSLPAVVAASARFSESPPSRAVLNDLSPHQWACLVVLDTAFIRVHGPLFSETSCNNTLAVRELLTELLAAIRRLPASAAGDKFSHEQDGRDMLAAYNGSASRASGGLHTIYCRAFDWHAARIARYMPRPQLEGGHL